MTGPKRLSSNDVEELQVIAIERNGGVLKPDLLESALARPPNEFLYAAEADIFKLTAIYADTMVNLTNKKTTCEDAARYFRKHAREVG